jgi:urease accessory protein
LRGIATAAVLLCLCSPRAEAHLVTTGLGPVYDGIAHLALSPADLAVVMALTLLAAVRGPRQGRFLLALLPAAWMAGGLNG